MSGQRGRTILTSGTPAARARMKLPRLGRLAVGQIRVSTSSGGRDARLTGASSARRRPARAATRHVRRPGASAPARWTAARYSARPAPSSSTGIDHDVAEAEPLGGSGDLVVVGDRHAGQTGHGRQQDAMKPDRDGRLEPARAAATPAAADGPSARSAGGRRRAPVGRRRAPRMRGRLPEPSSAGAVRVLSRRPAAASSASTSIRSTPSGSRPRTGSRTIRPSTGIRSAAGRGLEEERRIRDDPDARGGTAEQLGARRDRGPGRSGTARPQAAPAIAMLGAGSAQPRPRSTTTSVPTMRAARIHDR